MKIEDIEAKVNYTMGRDKVMSNYILATLGIVLDRWITTLLWEYESNPIVIWLGLDLWLLLSVILIFLLGFVSFYMKRVGDTQEIKITNSILLFIFGLHIMVFVGNISMATVVY